MNSLIEDISETIIVIESRAEGLGLYEDYSLDIKMVVKGFEKLIREGV